MIFETEPVIFVDNQFFGNKSGKGFYERTKKKDDKGRTIVNVLNLDTLTYAQTTRPKLPIVKEAKAIDLMSKRFAF